MSSCVASCSMFFLEASSASGISDYLPTGIAVLHLNVAVPC